MEARKELKEIKCPVGVAHNVISGKWKLVIIWILKDNVKRFNELQKALPGIRQSYLTQQLRELEKDGLVYREVYKEVPPKVEYSLTDIGREFLKVMDRMYEWGEAYMAFIENQ
ncbi:winged helix-turn-helix transcriptional regulator [Geosporobacter ferrireducens]|uniref:HxlR family transcriptional regulator n=1 Tax=Geosporobacter ferrireducens TaxID=1424294 RepID=A0A1D8GJA9_9FIRM|nr:helix-turn-helix domain-containing protein [Geosporobacter ferrireducens]AOT70989.1 HxlR family transcriptional regulator [Geosporobacter ferrireducens]MTI53706.1 helix-turn-helix transcriptional regulator [Geosporobacter ferrireducens]